MNSRKEHLTFASTLIRPILIGTLVGVAACMLLLFLAAYVASAFDIPQAVIVPLATVIAAMASFVGAFVGAKVAEKNGWLIGGMIGIVLFLVSIVAGIGFFDHLNGAFMLVKASVMVATGIIGGIVAVNCGGRRKRKR